MEIDNPEEGSIEAHVQALLNKGTPEQSKETEVQEAPQDTLEDDVEEDVTEAEGTEETEVEAEETEDQEDNTEPQKFTVKVDGKDVQVSLEEALAGYMKDQDYRNKTAKVAEERKLVETEKQSIADLKAVRENYLKESKTLQGIIETFIVPDDKLIEILKTKGSDAYNLAKLSNERIQQQITAIRGEGERVQNELTESQKKEIEYRQNTERNLLISAIPELKDDGSQRVLGKYILDLGYSQEEIEGVLDHRLFVVMEKARRWDDLQSKGKQKPVNKVPKVTKGGADRKTGQQIQTEKLRELQKKAKQTGSKNDHVALLLAKQTNGA